MKTRPRALFCFACKGMCQKTLRDINKGGFTCCKTDRSDTCRPTLLSLVTFRGTVTCGLIHLWGRNHVGWKSVVPFCSAKHFFPSFLAFLHCCQAFFLPHSIFFFLISLNVADGAVLLESGTKKHVTFLALHFFYSFCTTQTDGTDSKVTTLGFPQMNLEDAIQAQHEEKERSLPVGTLNFSLNSLELTGTGCYV